MTIEIQELIIQVWVEEDGYAAKSSARPALAQSQTDQNAIIEQITQQVLERLREKLEDWV